ncbi:hypothetical protein EZV62_011658 [Acer yangbiense]|uniref:Uncharacterized protein n=1 Tax=Acer yangbiense TaxID=1000413 RepID=A0A5C7I6A9_9ROSI|nr:hypothetical protein EZV62_011658 [Acer yangbiense]
MKYMKSLNLFDYVKKNNKNVKIGCDCLHMMGVDTGKMFTGLVQTNFALMKLYFFKVINMFWCRKPGQLAKYLDNVIEKRKIGGLLVGYSTMAKHELEADHSAMVFKWLNAAHESASLVDFPFTIVNERKSSNIANQILRVPDPEVHERVVNKFAASANSNVSQATHVVVDEKFMISFKDLDNVDYIIECSIQMLRLKFSIESYCELRRVGEFGIELRVFCMVDSSSLSPKDPKAGSSQAFQLPCRLGFGSIGQYCSVKANHLHTRFHRADTCLHRVTISKKTISKKVNHSVIRTAVTSKEVNCDVMKRLLESKLPDVIAVYDGHHSLYTCWALMEISDSLEFTITLGEDDKLSSQRMTSKEVNCDVMKRLLESKLPDVIAVYDGHHSLYTCWALMEISDSLEFTITLGEDDKLNSQRSESCFEVVLRHGYFVNNLVLSWYYSVGRSFYSTMGKRWPLGEELALGDDLGSCRENQMTVSITGATGFIGRKIGPQTASRICLACKIPGTRIAIVITWEEDGKQKWPVLRKSNLFPKQSSSMDVPKGYIAVYIGESQKKRFVIPVSFLNEPLFQELLCMAEEEFGFNHPMGGLTIPCTEDMFTDLTFGLCGL